MSGVWVSLCDLDLGLSLLAEGISSQRSELGGARGREGELGDSLPGSLLGLIPMYFPLQPWEGRTVQGKAQLGSGSGSLEVLSKGSLLGPAVPAGCVGSWVKDTAGTGSREGRAPWCRGEFQSELPGWCWLVAQWAADSPTGQYSSLELVELRICCLRESMCLEPHGARGLSPLTIQFPL